MSSEGSSNDRYAEPFISIPVNPVGRGFVSPDTPGACRVRTGTKQTGTELRMASRRFLPSMGTALSASQDSVNSPWAVEALAEEASMSRATFAARFKELLGRLRVQR